MQEPAYLGPLQGYLKARDLLREGEEVAAAEALEGAFGAEEPNSFLRRNLEIALDEKEPAGLVVIDGIYGEMKWRQRRSAKPRRSRK
jgi:hypothetical protein